MTLLKRFSTLALAGLVATLALSAHAASTTSDNVTPSIRVGFSPEGTAASLVLDVIKNAQRSIHMLSYMMTSPDIVNALIAAKQRGVTIFVVVDDSVNQSNEKSQECLKALLRAGISVRVTSAYHLLHDKVIIADENTVQTGSFNYTVSASNLNSENVVVVKDAPDVTAGYMNMWQSRWQGAKAYSVNDNTPVERRL